MTIKLLGELTVKIAHSLNSSSPSDTSQPRAEVLVLLTPAWRLLKPTHRAGGMDLVPPAPEKWCGCCPHNQLHVRHPVWWLVLLLAARQLSAGHVPLKAVAFWGFQGCCVLACGGCSTSSTVRGRTFPARLSDLWCQQHQ